MGKIILYDLLTIFSQYWLIGIGLKEKFRKIWLDDMQDEKEKNPLHQNKLETYRKLKNIFKLEPYLINCNKQQRQIMTKFRVSAHNLNIERGRYIGLKVEERTHYVILIWRRRTFFDKLSYFT